MKISRMYILLLLLSWSCKPAIDYGGITDVMNGDDIPLSEVKNIIDKTVKEIESSTLKSSQTNKYYNNANHTNTIYKVDGYPVKVSSIIKENTFTIQSTYYIRDGLPYYIQGTMRDKDRFSSNYTHQEISTYLNGTKVLQRLVKTAVNQENRASDLSKITQEDITHTIYAPELDAENRYKEVMKILGTPID